MNFLTMVLCRVIAVAIAYSFAISSALAGVLYVANGGGNSVFDYSTSPVAPLGAFVSSGSGGLSDPRGITFGPDGNVYVTGFTVDSAGNTAGHVFRYNGTTG